MSDGEFKTVGVALDTFKVKRFRAVLAENGYETQLHKGLTPDSALLRVKGVQIDKIEEFAKIINRLEYEFANRN